MAFMVVSSINTCVELTLCRGTTNLILGIAPSKSLSSHHLPPLPFQTFYHHHHHHHKLSPPIFAVDNSYFNQVMAAYAAAASLKNTIQRILQSSRISLVSHSPQILQPAYDEMDRLQRVLLGLDETSCSKIRTEVNAADERIKEAVWEFEDLLESHILPQILPQLESSRDHLSFPVDLQSLQHHVDCFVEMVKMMEEEYTIEVENMAEEEGEPISSRIDIGGMIKSKMVGLSHEFEKARDYLLEENNKLPYSIIGMAGVGKTTLAKKIFEDPSIQSHFEFRAWVRVGRKCESDELLRCVLAQVDPNAYRMLTQGDEEEEEIVRLLKERLKGKKCLIVLDDIWDKEADRLTNCLLGKNIVGRIRFLLTSRQQTIYTEDGYQRVRFLNDEESKKLLGEKVFGEEDFPIQLEELGEMIAWKCEGLPLMIITVAELLSKADKTPEYWADVLKQRSSVFMDAYNQISKVFFPSYDYLPQHLKMLFLYMGAFRPYIDMILPSMLNNLLSAEGFLELIGEEGFGDFFNICLEKLYLRYHLVLNTTNSLFELRRHMYIKKRGFQSYMPGQIWDMQELEHIQIGGRDLPTPHITDDATLNKLVALIGVSANSCTREVLKRIPNLAHLGIEVELKPYDDDETNPLSCLSYISQLQNLVSLAYRIRNPEMKYKFNTIPLSMFPSSLTVLILSGLGYPWKYMNDIGSLLPNLLTLWRPQRGSFPDLVVLIMKDCYKLQQLDWPYDHSWITRIGLVDCSPLAIACANQLKDNLKRWMFGGKATSDSHEEEEEEEGYLEERDGNGGLMIMVKMMEFEYFIEMLNMPEEEGEPISSRIDSGGMIKSKMVGLSHEFEYARDYLPEENNNEPFSIIGMAGVGKTTLAKHIFEDPSIQRHFEVRAWVRVGRKCESDEVLRCILAQVDPNTY
ncbi:disease resistance RPP13-like protein 4 [Salvia miltiorrhiza]|uniref:disease resistance RPP13-like protein 4 n=1 Tax=Salvia miltiorrhiza TaxID=226208 RepID=UPI0025ABB1B7|nr:disease resistance RPP13-like protein 4 [Salvia miltiorrhiza]